MSEKSDALGRVRKAAEALGLVVEPVVMPAETRSAEDAARACGCVVGRIVKSLVFRGAESGRPVLLLVSGANRVDEKVASALLGEPIVRPDAAFVRAETGFAIGGIPPFGHSRALPTFIDRDLLTHQTVWAAAGTPKAVFEVDPCRLAAATGAAIVAMV
ncbi:YbaK/EbsC family protein [Prosthecomicrobium pneumaticum]|uniref:Prolyl-tRNA editing enzyme YbaK/EbsC (Cys-tRNA(Pro) deacylase) n=1 Tax=Prosthecomicrobium pneumaticum TaxID=81895 RepID=A0A7W9FLC6_9HYPH|nr:YbaK/EbsC family protein [Prosthecomicrobium pneumaticum]MBB5752788.1 prolyl-tRNA editing enzyme YbaK/EbsC (Cys-tRNA(Pro) deacylase) [Prosthecomicrobium pneumaticum]